MNRMQEQVLEFHRAMGIAVGETIGLREHRLRIQLISEEALETIEAIARGDMVEAIDGLADLAYVVFGACVTFGIDLEPYFDEVHRSNMLKVGGGVSEIGRVQKPPDWKPPRIAELLHCALVMEQFRKRGNRDVS